MNRKRDFENIKELNKFKGCILGLTIGNSLGFPIEFVKSLHLLYCLCIIRKINRKGI